VLLGHMQAGSICVKEGDHVETGRVIGQVGNSGWTDQPHTHIQAMTFSEKSVWSGEGIPITFEGRNPVKARLFIR
jgi:murein DD-endopeptidase MepM/ murein hydrolase activator NlpD